MSKEEKENIAEVCRLVIEIAYEAALINIFLKYVKELTKYLNSLHELPNLTVKPMLLPLQHQED